QPLPGYHPVVGAVLAARGHDNQSASAFMQRDGLLHDPLLLPGMPDAVRTVSAAVNNGERIAVYGDYDADGVTACAMLVRAFRNRGVDCVPYIPNRMTEGYGLHGAALAELGECGVSCVITVDCGTSSVDVAQGRPSGMRLVVTDHHLPATPDGEPRLAPADALVNPKLEGSLYPFDGLAGAGVAFKLVQALEKEGVLDSGAAAAALPLAALGTIADLMPLRGENRAIVQRGMAELSNVPGVRALCECAALPLALRASDVAFGVGPRINAAGRMEDAKLALDLCLADDPAAAHDLALQLDGQNRRRQLAVVEALAEAEEQVAMLDDDAAAIVVGAEHWPMGVVGLVAGRLVERYARPAFAVSLDPGEAKGSARSVPGVHIVRALDGAASTLIRYGGHVAAAGFSLQAQRFEEFRRAVEAAVAEQLDGAPRQRTFEVDAVLTASESTPVLCRELEALEPCGQGNPSPLLALRDARVLTTSAFGAERQHLRIVLGGADGVLEAIAFHKPGLEQHLPRGRRIDACFSVEMDSWQGQDRVRARLRDLRPAEAAAPVALAG
ncbi:MAG: single-stranded-DNA-specific exonuclease RecJ, partial [Candidatus Dormibacteraeota bacterium]|nr:single-stranded-DNA-specific exonuclease RecJ [Candidatus Dormibacteraeota bacterium]